FHGAGAAARNEIRAGRPIRQLRSCRRRARRKPLASRREHHGVHRIHRPGVRNEAARAAQGSPAERQSGCLSRNERDLGWAFGASSPQRGAKAGANNISCRTYPTNYADAFALMTRDRPDALFVAYHPTNYVNRQRIADFGIAQRIPAMVPYREATMAGGLMSYGVSVTGQYRRVAGLVDKILKGAKPADIPVERPTRLELVIKLATAKAIGLDLPPTLLDRADEVIQ